jgi:Ca2+-binding RTX toxin-like protein
MFYLYNVNDGTSAANAVWRAFGVNDTVVVAERVILYATGSFSTVFKAAYGNVFTIGGLISASLYGIRGEFGSSGNVTVTVQETGTVTSGSNAIFLENNFNAVINAGTISGVQGVALGGYGNSVVNSGLISARTVAVEIGGTSTSQGAMLNNSGTITSASFNNATVVMGSLGNATVVNSGTIANGAGGYVLVPGYDVATELTNSGTIDGRVVLGGREDVVRNSGTLAGLVRLGGGEDLYDGSGGTIGARVDGEDGNDQLIGGGGADVLEGGAGADRIHGGAGFDTASYSTDVEGVTVDLADQTRNAGTAEGDLLTEIEKTAGGRGADRLSGAGADDTLAGADGADVLAGREGADWLIGGDGDDILQGGTGNDVLVGGAGTDSASFAEATAGVTVTLGAGWHGVRGLGRDRFVSIEGLVGSAFDDVLTGAATNDRLAGGAGDDALAGGAGDDELNGGAGRDMLNGGGGKDVASYAGAAAAVTVSLLARGAQDTGGGGIDTLVSIEGLFGSDFNDRLTGDQNDNVLRGGAGNDRLVGGDGSDTADYADAARAVTVRLATTTAQDTRGAGTDTLTGIENLTGSAFNDTLIGDAGDNVLRGGPGDDVLNGGGGVDTADYGDASGGLVISLLVAEVQNTGGGGFDTLTNIENLTGGAFNDKLTGDARANRLDGGAGNDTLNGGDGNDRLADVLGTNTLNGGLGTDTADFSALGGSLWLNAAENGILYTFKLPENSSDTLTSIETVWGSAHDDRFVMDFAALTLRGGRGADSFTFYQFAADFSTILDFSGADGDGDVLILRGFSAAATFTQVDATHWQVTDGDFVETITFANAPLITAADWSFADL